MGVASNSGKNCRPGDKSLTWNVQKLVTTVPVQATRFKLASLESTQTHLNISVLHSAFRQAGGMGARVEHVLGKHCWISTVEA